MSDSRHHKNVKNQIRAALGEREDVICFNNESGVGRVGVGSAKCSHCGQKTKNAFIEYGLGDGGSDLVCVVDGGGSLFMEVKTGAATQQGNQKRFAEKMRKQGAIYVTVRCVEHASAAVDFAIDWYRCTGGDEVRRWKIGVVSGSVIYRGGSGCIVLWGS